MSLPEIWEEVRKLPSFLFKERPGSGYPTIKTDEVLFRLRNEVIRSIQTYEGMVETRELVIAQHLEKFEVISEWAFNMSAMYEDCTYLSHEAFDKDAKTHLSRLIEVVGPWVPPELREETTEVEPEPDKYKGFKVFNYLKITEEAFMALPPGICRHPDCTRETGTAMALCRWHSIAFKKWGKKMGAPLI